MTFPFPDFYRPEQVGSLYLERGGEVAAAAVAQRERWGIPLASQDRLRIAALGIDCQVGFCLPEASLFVPGAVEDTRRTVEWLYRNLGQITALHFSLDTHQIFQIFHPAWWVDPAGRHPAPMTAITAAEVRSGRWRALNQPEASLEYCEKLEAGGKYTLMIWPYHTLLGGLSHALVPALAEAALFHTVARRSPTGFEIKGYRPETENYSVFSPEVTEVGGRSVGGFNQVFFETLMSFDRVYVFGQAKSHCVLSTLRDLRAQIQRTDPTKMDRIWILEDAMSPVPAPPLEPLPPSLDFPQLAEEGLAELSAAGMRRVRTSDPVEG